MKVIQSSKYRENQDEKVLCFEIRKLHLDYYCLRIYLDRYCRLCIGEIKVEGYRIDEDNSQITLVDLNGELFGILRYRIIFDMED